MLGPLELIHRLFSYLHSLWLDCSIEPAIFVYSVSGGLLWGAGALSELKLWKVRLRIEHLKG